MNCMGWVGRGATHGGERMCLGCSVATARVCMFEGVEPTQPRAMRSPGVPRRSPGAARGPEREEIRL